MVSIYYNPEAFGLREVGQIEWTEPFYSFDTTVLWERPDDGKLFWESDSGCSCPSPFEGANLSNINQGSFWEFEAYVKGRLAEHYEPQYAATQVVLLLEKARNL